MLIDTLKAKAIEKRLIGPDETIDAEQAFLLVRDMPYIRASSRDPETIIREWRGTCSGKHILLKKLLAELGISSRLIACTTEVHINPREVYGRLRALLEKSGGRLVDIHNYLILDLPGGEMIIDATWPASTKDMGTVVNERFVPGKNQRPACAPIKTWVVPDGRDPQDFKNELLAASFTPEELRERDEIIRELGRVTSSPWVKLYLRIRKLVRRK
jgi:hypothetical protein